MPAIVNSELVCETDDPLMFVICPVPPGSVDEPAEIACDATLDKFTAPPQDGRLSTTGSSVPHLRRVRCVCNNNRWRPRRR
jgi:hypothetical protein